MQTYVNTPELLYRLEGDDLLQQVIPVVALAAGRLGEPQCPPVGKRVLDVEVVLVMEDGLDLRGRLNAGRGLVAAIW